MRQDRVIADYDKTACLEMTEELTARRCYPCGICTKVCPIGKDRSLVQTNQIHEEVFEETEALAKNPDDPEYKSLDPRAQVWGCQE